MQDLTTFLAANMGLNESDVMSAMEATHVPRFIAGSPNMEVGLGWHIRTQGGEAIVVHHGATGGFWSFGGFDKERQIGVVVLTNSSENIDDIGYRLLEEYPTP